MMVWEYDDIIYSSNDYGTLASKIFKIPGEIKEYITSEILKLGVNAYLMEGGKKDRSKDIHNIRNIIINDEIQQIKQILSKDVNETKQYTMTIERKNKIEKLGNELSHEFINRLVTQIIYEHNTIYKLYQIRKQIKNKIKSEIPKNKYIYEYFNDQLCEVIRILKKQNHRMINVINK
jgi:hypothetical protein